MINCGNLIRLRFVKLIMKIQILIGLLTILLAGPAWAGNNQNRVDIEPAQKRAQERIRDKQEDSRKAAQERRERRRERLRERWENRSDNRKRK